MRLILIFNGTSSVTLGSKIILKATVYLPDGQRVAYICRRRHVLGRLVLLHLPILDLEWLVGARQLGHAILDHPVDNLCNMVSLARGALILLGLLHNYFTLFIK